MCEPYQDTNIYLRQFWEIEKIPEYATPPMPQKDQDILEETARSTILVDDRYQVKLPWKKLPLRFHSHMTWPCEDWNQLNESLRNFPY